MHGHSVYPIFGVILGILSKVAGVKSVFTLYSSLPDKNKGSNYPEGMSMLRFSKNKNLVRILSLFVDVIIVTSNTAKKSLISIGIPKNKVKYIPVGTDLTVFRPLNTSKEVKTKLNIPFDKRIILFAGDISPWKGLDIFLKSVSIISKKYPDILCIIMTKGLYEHKRERREEINNLIKLNSIEEYIYIIGQWKNIQEIYGMSDIIVFPFTSSFSVMDIPLSLLEAMAMSKPVIATRVGSFDEAITNLENGLLIERNNVSKLAEAIIALLDDPILCKNLSENARKYINEKHDIKIISHKLEKLYNNLKIYE